MQISIANFSAIPSFDLRIDPEFYEPTNLELENILQHHKSVPLGELCYLYDGPFGSELLSSSYSKDGVPALRMQNVSKDGLPNLDNVEFISEDEADRLHKHIAFSGDVVTTKIGFLGYTTVLPNNYERYFFRRELTRLVIKEGVKLLPQYLATFLNTSYGRNQALRFSTGTTRDRVLLVNQRHMLIPIFSTSLQTLVENTIKQAQDTIESGTSYFKEAENMLLSELGLVNWQPKHQHAFIKNFSDTQQAERIDAEYYQPKYEEIEDAIKNYKGGHSNIGNEFEQNKSTFNVEGSKVYQYVEIGSVNVVNGEVIPNDVLGEELPANAKRKLNKDDVIVSKVRTYRGAITIVEEDDYVGSGAFTVLAENGQINKETLLVFLHSKPLLAWSLKPNTGTSYPVIVDEDILNMPIPLLPTDIQNSIKQKVTESFNLRKQSQQLLESAKKAVEMAIEQDEQGAIDWLKAQTKSIGVDDADGL